MVLGNLGGVLCLAESLSTECQAEMVCGCSLGNGIMGGYVCLMGIYGANCVFSLCVVGYIVLFVMDMPIHALVSLNKHIFLPFCMVFIVVTLFVGRHGETSRMERVLDYVGKRTLDVYVIHYFFIWQIHLAGLAKAWEASGNALLTFVLAFFLSAIVTALAIGVGNILHYGILIEKIVYGK